MARRTVFFVIWGCLALILGQHETAQAQQAQKAQQGPEVLVLPARVQTVPLHREYPSRIESAETVEIRARVEGYLQRVAFKEGELVQKGDLLFQIDPSQLQASLRDAKASLDKARTDLEAAKAGVDVLRSQAELAKSQATWKNARDQAARYLALVKQDFISRQEYDTAQAAADEAAALVEANKAVLVQSQVNQKADIDRGKAAVEAAQAQVAQAELNLSYATIAAPVSGRIGVANVKPGALVGRGESTLMATITTIDPVYVTFQFDEKDYVTLSRRLNAQRKAGKESDPGVFELILADGSLYEHNGTFNMVGSTLDASTGTLPVRTQFPNPDRLLREGQFARIRVKLDEIQGAVTIPQRAVGELQGMPYVYVVENKLAKQRRVKLGDRFGAWVVVLEGLQGGEEVVVDGLQKIRPDMPVQPKPAPDISLGGSSRTVS